LQVVFPVKFTINWLHFLVLQGWKKNYQNVTVGVLNLGTPNLFLLASQQGKFLFVTLSTQLSLRFVEGCQTSFEVITKLEDEMFY
jgi:hypothetical protein